MSDPGGPSNEQLPEIGEVVGRLSGSQAPPPGAPAPRDVVPDRKVPLPPLSGPPVPVRERRPRRERRRSRFSRRRTGLALAATGLIVVGGIGGLGFGTTSTHERSFVLAGAVQRLEITAGTSDVRVVVGASDQVDVSTRQRRFAHCAVDPANDGSTSTVDVSCGDSTVSVPARVEVVVKSGTGDVTLAGATAKGVTVEGGTGDVTSEAQFGGPVAVTTTTGDVKLESASAAGAWVRTTTGDVNVDANAVKKVSIASTTGDVKLDAVADVPDIDVNTTTGDIGLDLSPDRHYKTDINVGAGDDELGYQQGPSTDGTLVVRSNTGDLTREG